MTPQNITSQESKYSFLPIFKAREDLTAFGDNSLLLYALELKFAIEDINTVAAECLTDGTDDKKCDLVYVDTENGVAVVAQGYYSIKPAKKVAPVNKASDLNTAATWLFSREINDKYPRQIYSAARVLRDALESGEIKNIEFWYVHNCRESHQVRDELASVERTVKSFVRSDYTSVQEVTAKEIGLETIEQWYKGTQVAILVTDRYSVSVPGGYTLEEGGQWSAFTTAVPAKWLHELYNKHGDDLFSANVRGYLGSRSSDKNINAGIKNSVANQPEKFWTFNNGITALVVEFVVSKNKKKVDLVGISIVNGAQTTGAIGSVKDLPDVKAMVPARFIKCKNPETIQEIVRYNNSQNRIQPADFRSTDPYQERLRQEFSSYGTGITYLGGRRGGSSDKIKKKQAHSHIPSDTAAQSLAAFHQKPRLATKDKGEIWKSDNHYSQLFNENTRAEHVVFVYSLHLAVRNYKLSLSRKFKEAIALTKLEQKILNFFEFRGSIWFFITAIGHCMETILDKPVTNKLLIRFNQQKSLSDAENDWKPIVQVCMPFSTLLEPALEKALISESIALPLNSFEASLMSTRLPNTSIYEEFENKLSMEPWL